MNCSRTSSMVAYSLGFPMFADSLTFVGSLMFGALRRLRVPDASTAWMGRIAYLRLQLVKSTSAQCGYT
ncbi:hypothetical protein PC118_g7079 [Phytophthora cactorum]|uniref:Uncharacterized protein n=1 Tax=Phytophthora cactorum TaxID=29920 RepID=A0A8T1G3R1_9STRA|nr:hypothetical protein PC111_g19993 [Phytophthora cactorum]KAG2833716.1 hypothetical protein PC113_g20522 [Phytophthora cactorum]KAG2879141.1 hypothetical protein PC114_g22726 [Phytophthora cactorum]KAG2987846.1 hypothetical protein PC118_g7079 [Phytophthora cactorum]KAG3058419.1 hypothetical protein PC122_g20701 [Phytophthora cactorum]